MKIRVQIKGPDGNSMYDEIIDLSVLDAGDSTGSTFPDGQEDHDITITNVTEPRKPRRTKKWTPYSVNLMAKHRAGLNNRKPGGENP